MDFTNPKEMISRVKPGYFTDFNAVFTCSSEIDIREPYASCAKRKRMPRLSVLVIEFVPDLIIVSARGTSRLLAGFRNEIWVLPLRPGAVFRLHRVGRQTKVKNSVCAAREFQNEQALRRAEVEFDVASTHTGVCRCIRMPVTRHCVAVRVQLRLNVGKTFERL